LYCCFIELCATAFLFVVQAYGKSEVALSVQLNGKADVS
jgi:hypothetical protein